MAGEVQFSFKHLATAYFTVRNRVGQIWSTSGGTGAFETYATAHWADYAISATEQGTASAFFVGTFPAAIPPGVYGILAKQQIGGSAAETDPTIAVGDYQWNGTVTLPLSDLATSGQVGLFGPIRLAKGVAISGFPFKLVGSQDHITPFTSGVVSGQVSRDGGAFGPLQSGAFTEMGLGWWRVNLTSGDLNGGTVALVFTATGISGGTSDPRDIAIITQKVSGSV